MKRNNKALYEQIIWNVSREVKRALNEADETSSIKYINSDIFCILTEDNFEEGENPDTSERWTETHFKRKASSIKEVVEQIADFYGCDYDSINIYEDYVDMGTTTDEYANRLSDEDIELWKQGKIKGYSLLVRFNVFKQSPVTHDELVASGFESYE